jgi:diguanylate cyclase (GGDEF)-like protein
MPTLTKKRAIFLGFLGVTLVGALDAAIGFEISLFILHVIPILLVTWFATLRWGLFFSVLMMAISGLTIAYSAPGMAHPHYRYLDLASDFIGTLLLVFMLSRLRMSYESVSRQSKSDALTGCLNKSGFSEQLQAEIDRDKRYDHPFSLMYFDCDNFKMVNDTHGHHTGDALLTEIGRVLRAESRAVDSVGRLGGDEFAVLLRETDGDAAQRAVALLKRALDLAMRAHRWPVSFSIGIASFDKAPTDAARALLLADSLMYEVKKQGKNGIRIQRF